MKGQWALWGGGSQIPIQGGSGALIQALQQHQIDVAILPTCVLEESKSATSLKDIEALNPVSRYMIPCLHSTWLYPGPILTSSEGLEKSQVKRLTRFLISVPSSPTGYQWRLPPPKESFQPLESLLTELGMDSYSLLEKNTYIRFWEKYAIYIYVVFFLLLGLLVHYSFLNFLVKKKTKQLRMLIKEREQQYEKDRKTNEKLEAMQKVSIVGLMSSMFAHEIRQPLSSIRCWLYSIKALSKEKNTSNEIEDFVQQANNEVSRIEQSISTIRSYIQTEQKSIGWTNFYELIKSALDSLPTNERMILKTVWKQCNKYILIEVNIFEMKLALINAFRNSLEAQAGNKSKTIFLSLFERDSAAVLTISDLGKPMDPQDFTKIGKLFFSKKKGGMGLGLAVIHSILAKYQGRLELSLIETNRLQVKFILPITKNETFN